jgi:hypothetical protein
MAIAENTIDHVSLQRLVEAGAVRGADVVGQPGGWNLIVKYGIVERSLATRRGEVRLFSRFETLLGYLRGLGIVQFTVNASNFDPAVKRTSRPDVAKRLQNTFGGMKVREKPSRSASKPKTN